VLFGAAKTAKTDGAGKARQKAEDVERRVCTWGERVIPKGTNGFGVKVLQEKGEGPWGQGVGLPWAGSPTGLEAKMNFPKGGLETLGGKNG